MEQKGGMKFIENGLLGCKNYFVISVFSIFFEPEEFYIASEQVENEPKGGIAVIRGWTVTKLDPEKKIAFLDDGTEIQYEKCLLATGIHPKNLPVFEDTSEKFQDKVNE